MVKILYNGTTGQVGRAISNSSTQSSQEWIGISSSECNLLDLDSITQLFEQHQPDYFIQVAAYTAVDKAEEDKDNAYAVNTLSTSHIAALCQKHHTTLLYVSSDYVYHCNTQQPIKETTVCTPQGIYAKSKHDGEKAIISQLPQHIILRTSWVYDQEGHNFVNTMLRLGTARESLTIVGDQYGAPTYAPDIANALITIIDTLETSKNRDDLYGIYNFANLGVTTWSQFAKEIFAIANIDCIVTDITTEQFGAPAPRPQWSVLSTEKYRTTFDQSIRTWQECLRDCLSGKKMA